MKVTEVKKKARALGLKTRGMNKGNMIRAIQSAEGNFPCFGSAHEDCDQASCCWREDCLPTVRM